jgi:AAHS family 4-hydroxybenzoate transporter-like MFS transporter
MSLDPSTLRLPDFVDERRVSRFQYGVITLCGLVMFLDGFDTQAISYMAPHIAKEWGLPTAVLGPIFSSALVGLMIGYLVLSPLSDRFGHKRVIVAAVAGFAVCTLVAVWTAGVTELIVLRFLTGLGLGAAAPSCVAMTGEFSPKRLRATFVLAIYCGFSLGFVVAGLVAGWLIPIHGWRSMFWVGAIAPLVLLPLLLRFLPESPVFMLRRGRDPQRVHQVFRRIDPTIAPTEAPRFDVAGEDSGKRAALSSLFTRDRVLGTALLWFVFAINLAEFYALQSWLPTILAGLDYDMSVVVTTTTLTTVGGIAAAFITGPAMDRDRYRVRRPAVGADDRELPRGLRDQRWTEEPDRTRRRVLPGLDALHRGRLGARDRPHRGNPRSDHHRRGTLGRMVGRSGLLRDGRPGARGWARGAGARPSLRGARRRAGRARPRDSRGGDGGGVRRQSCLLYHPEGVYTADDKQALADDISELYVRVGALPKFYVSVIFHELPSESFYIGGRAAGNFVRIWPGSSARSLRARPCPERSAGQGMRLRYRLSRSHVLPFRGERGVAVSHAARTSSADAAGSGSDKCVRSGSKSGVASRRTPDMVIAASGLVSVARMPQITIRVACTSLLLTLHVLRTCAA